MVSPEAGGIVSDDGYKIGFVELYTELRQLGERLSEFMSKQTVQSNSMDHRIEDLAKDLLDMQARMEAEKLQRDQLVKQFWFSILTSLILPIGVLIIWGFVSKNGG